MSDEPAEPDPAPASRVIAHADGTLTLTEQAVVVEVTRGSGYRGTLRVSRRRCRVLVMGRAVAVFDGDVLLHLCSRCKPTSEVKALVDALGDRAVVERRTSLGTLLSLREVSAAYRPPGVPRETAAAPQAASEPAPAPDVPEGYEGLQRVYASEADRERDARRLRAAGWVAQGEESTVSAAQESERGRLRGLLEAASPKREVGGRVVLWIRPLPADLD